MNPKTRFYLLIVSSLLAGLLIAWIDNRPNWDDTGITAGMLVLASALFGYLDSSRPWMWALTVSGWIPLYAIAQSGDFKLLFICLFGFAGSYLGAAIRNNKPAE